MSNLQHRQQKIQAKRKQTPWRDFVMEICNWYPLMFYKNQGLISKYSPNNNRVSHILTSIDYENHRNDLYNTIVSIDKKFWPQFEKLFTSSQHESLKIFQNCENCDYSDITFASKNAYLSSCVLESENVLYSIQVKGKSANVLNSFLAYNNCQNVFESKMIIKSSDVYYSAHIQNSSSIYFSSNLIGCYECILCSDLKNQSYCIENIIYEKDLFEQKKKEILRQKYRFQDYKSGAYMKPGMNIGDNIYGSSNLMCENIQHGYFNYAVKNARNVCLSGDSQVMENIYDAFSTGCQSCNHYYGVMGVGYNASHIYCCIETAVNSYNCYYSYYLESCSFCLGCIGLKNKSYCILNKQYTKEERYEKVDEIFSQMEQDGTLGDFFPASMSPFYFNDTAAYLIDPTFTKEEVTAKGYLWRDEAIKVDIPADAQIVSTSELDQYEGYDADGKRTINPSILDKVIQDTQGNVYKIVKMELAFLIKHGLPLPRKHRLDRMKENFRIG